MKRPKPPPTDEQALRAGLQALADAGTIVVPKTLGTVPIGDGEGGMH